MAGTLNLTITGMTCGHCARTVTQALQAVPGVASAAVDLKAGTAVVQGDPDPTALVAAVEDEGYGAVVKP